MRIPMKDLIVVLPGITGSVLQKDGNDVWALSGKAISTLLRTHGHSLKSLQIAGQDDPELDDLGDGVVAHRLMPDAHIVPGLWKVDGYQTLTRFLKAEFLVEEGQNYLEVPYDWRRDNRVAARKLQRLIFTKLRTWRERSGYSSAKVILIAHSMGGLICRHYLEVMEGWKECRALISFGTPYRGSVKALNFLANGYRVAGINLSAMLCSCASVYQLLPTYPMIRMGDGPMIRPSELKNVSGLRPERAREARTFHKLIEYAVDEHMKLEEYRNGFVLWPVVGSDQVTLQSAAIAGIELVVSECLPTGVDVLMNYGDGTVPLTSGLPLEMSRQFTFPFHSERHGSLQNNARILSALRGWLRQSQVEDLANLKTAAAQPNVRGQQSALRLIVEDLYQNGDPILIRAEVQCDREPSKIIGTIYRIDEESEPVRQSFIKRNGSWILECNGLVEGRYRIRVNCADDNFDDLPRPVSDIFDVVYDNLENIAS